MREITLDLQLKTLPDIMLRGQHALILVRDLEGKFILGCKKMYPENICRMVGGGIEANEDPGLGAARELQEELAITAMAQDLVPLAKITANIKTPNQQVTFTTFIYFYQLKSADIQFGSDLDGVVHLTTAELEQLITKYQQLSPILDPELHFAWSDYGQLYGQVHQIALDEYRTLDTPNPNLSRPQV